MKKGFTLIELLGVITILALIALIVVPQVNNASQKQRKKLFKTNVESIIKIVQTDIIENELIRPVTYTYNGTSLIRNYNGVNTSISYTGIIEGVKNATIIINEDIIILNNFTNGVFTATYNNGVVVQ